jgi:hypothetical protein
MLGVTLNKRSQQTQCPAHLLPIPVEKKRTWIKEVIHVPLGGCYRETLGAKVLAGPVH